MVVALLERESVLLVHMKPLWFRGRGQLVVLRVGGATMVATGERSSVVDVGTRCCFLLYCLIIARILRVNSEQ